MWLLGASPFAQRDTRQNILGGCPPSQHHWRYTAWVNEIMSCMVPPVEHPFQRNGSLEFPCGTFRIDSPAVDEGEVLTKIDDMHANQLAVVPPATTLDVCASAAVRPGRSYPALGPCLAGRGELVCRECVKRGKQCNVKLYYLTHDDAFAP